MIYDICIIFMTKSLSFNVNLSLCLILVLDDRFGTNRLFWYRLFVLALAVCFGTSYLFLYHLFILVPLTYFDIDNLNLSQFNSKDETRFFGIFSPIETRMNLPFTRGIPHLEGCIQASTRIKAWDQGRTWNIAYELI